MKKKIREQFRSQKFIIEKNNYKRLENLRRITGVSITKMVDAAVIFFLENVTIGEGTNLGNKIYLKRNNCSRKPIELTAIVDAEHAEYLRGLNPGGLKKIIIEK